MNPPLKTLLALVGISAVTLAFAVPKRQERLPKVLEDLVVGGFTISEFGPPGDMMTPEMSMAYGERIREVARLTRLAVGSFRSFREVAKTHDDGLRIEYDLELEFERGTVPAHVRLARPEGKWLVDDLTIDIPSELEIKPAWDMIPSATKAVFEQYLRGDLQMVWSLMDRDLQSRTDQKAFFTSRGRRERKLGGWQPPEQVGEPERIGDDRVRVAMISKAGKGRVEAVFEWHWQDVMWVMSEFDLKEIVDE